MGECLEWSLPCSLWWEDGLAHTLIWDFQPPAQGKNRFLWFKSHNSFYLVFPGDSAVKDPPAVQEPQETQVRSLGQEDPLEEGRATHSSILTWRIPWTEEPGELQSMGWLRV